MDYDSEEWRELPGTIYLVSNHGRVKNTKTNYIKKTDIDRYGYVRTNIHGKNKLMHRVVCSVWLSDYSENLTVNHKNFNRTDNRSENLEMASIGDNIRKSSSVGRYTRNGEKNNNCKRSFETILMLKTYIQSGFSDTEIAKITLIPRKYINDIKLGKIRNGN
jgi:hypothetical protein